MCLLKATSNSSGNAKTKENDRGRNATKVGRIDRGADRGDGMNREAMRRRKETAGVIRKIDAHDMATRKPCETALKQKGHKAFACDFKRADRTNTDTIGYIASKHNIKKPIPGGD